MSQSFCCEVVHCMFGTQTEINWSGPAVKKAVCQIYWDIAVQGAEIKPDFHHFCLIQWGCIEIQKHLSLVIFW